MSLLKFRKIGQIKHFFDFFRFTHSNAFSVGGKRRGVGAKPIDGCGANTKIAIHALDVALYCISRNKFSKQTRQFLPNLFATPSVPQIQLHLPIVMHFIALLMTSFTTDKYSTYKFCCMYFVYVISAYFQGFYKSC